MRAEDGVQGEGVVDLLFTENETNNQRLFNGTNAGPYVKDGINDCVVHGRQEAVNPDQVGTKASAHYRLTIAAGGSQEGLLVRESGARPAPAPAGAGGLSARLFWLGSGVALAIGVTTAILFVWKPAARSSAEGPSVQFTVSAPDNWILNESSPFMALSPDGRSLLFTATSRTAERAVWLRSLDSGATRQIAGSEGGTQPAEEA